MACICEVMKERAIWLTILPLAAVFVFLAHADLSDEDIAQKPHGH